MDRNTIISVLIYIRLPYRRHFVYTGNLKQTKIIHANLAVTLFRTEIISSDFILSSNSFDIGSYQIFSAALVIYITWNLQCIHSVTHISIVFIIYFALCKVIRNMRNFIFGIRNI